MQKSKLDQFFSIPAAAVLMAIVCNVLWGSAFPFIKLGYRLFAIDSADTASILCFAGVRFMIGAALVWLAGLALNHRPLPMPRGKTLASACGLGLWQTAAQYIFLLLCRRAADRRYGRHSEQYPELYGRHSGALPLRQ